MKATSVEKVTWGVRVMRVTRITKAMKVMMFLSFIKVSKVVRIRRVMEIMSAARVIGARGIMPVVFRVQRFLGALSVMRLMMVMET